MTSTIPESTILKTDGLGRVRTPLPQREALLDAFERCGLSGMKFAALRGVKDPSFANWVQQRKRCRHLLRLEVAQVELLAGHHPGITADLPDQLVCADIKGIDLRRAMLQETIRETTGGSSSIQAAEPGRMEPEALKGPFPSNHAGLLKPADGMGPFASYWYGVLRVVACGSLRVCSSFPAVFWLLAANVFSEFPAGLDFSGWTCFRARWS